MTLPWPRSLFARLMLILLVGILIVIAASLALFVGERERIGRAALFDSVAQEIAATADVLDHLSAAERERWIDELGRRRLRLALRPPSERLQALPDSHPLPAALRAAMPGRSTVAYTHERPGMRHAVIVALVNLAKIALSRHFEHQHHVIQRICFKLLIDVTSQDLDLVAFQLFSGHFQEEFYHSDDL